MSYLALARKYRPSRFADLVGQEHVRQALANALSGDRLHHAYLFSGTRGVGKTTIARLFAKAINCAVGPVAEPCGSCAACVAMDAGRFMDLLEIDAASRTKVEDTRELLESALYAPVNGRYKVFLIDEVHMFSKSSFNALLKTLEEPPPHIKFLLATTDPQKLPPTVLSRCLHFQLRALPAARIAEYLGTITRSENVEAEPAALRAVARAARGSLRDALSVLDQAIAHGNGQVTLAEVAALLGTLDASYAVQLLSAVAAGDAGAALRALDAAQLQAPDPGSLLEELQLLLAQIALNQYAPDAPGMVELDAAALADFAARLTPQEVQLYYQITLAGRRDLPLAPDPRTGMEMLVLRLLAFRPEGGGAPESTQRAPAALAPAQSRSEGRDAVPARVASGAPIDGRAGRAPAAAETPAVVPVLVPVTATESAAPSGAVAWPTPETWPRWLTQLELGGMARELARHCVLVRAASGTIELALDPRSKALQTSTAEAHLRAALTSRVGTPVTLRIQVAAATLETPARRSAEAAQVRDAAARSAVNDDAVGRALQTTFGATLIEATVVPDPKSQQEANEP